MSERLETRLAQRNARKRRIRKKISGDAVRPRVTVFLSNRGVYAQLINDKAGTTIAAVSSVGSNAVGSGKGTDAARAVGAALADKAESLGIKNAVFDRNGYRYHGRIKELAQAMREKGLLT